jgi:preprotein translocase subunit SecG
MLLTIITVIHVLLAAALIGLVLFQRGKGAEAGAAFGAGASGTVFGARGSASFLTRTTAVLATFFFVTSLSLAYLSGQREGPVSVLETGTPAEAPADQLPGLLPVPDEQLDLPDLPPPPSASEEGGAEAPPEE